LGEFWLSVVIRLRLERYANARMAIRSIDPSNPALETLSAPDYIPSEQDIQRLDAARVAAESGPTGQSIADLRSSGLEDAHHMIQNAAVRDFAPRAIWKLRRCKRSIKRISSLEV
jgi:hypothetical protein